MRIIKSKGTSYTRFEPVGRGGPRAAARGLKLRAAPDGSATIIPANDLPDFIESEDLDLILRQFVQALDKVVRKPRSFSRLDLATYLARARLGEALWDAFAREYCPIESVEPENLERLRIVWRAKVHPYVRRDTVSWEAPHSDQNAKDLAKREAEAQDADKQNEKPFGRTRWTDVFGDPFPDRAEIDQLRRAALLRDREVGQRGQHFVNQAYRLDPSLHSGIAKRIVDHLRAQELTISARKRTRGKQPTGYGLVEKRGESIAQNAADLVAQKSADPDGVERIPNATERWIWDDKAVSDYFLNDVAAEIRRAVLVDPATNGNRRAFGAMLYAHLGALGGPDKEKRPPLRRKVWALHNQVRAYYARLAESTRFRRALAEAQGQSSVKLDGLLPQDSKDLLTRLGAKKRNSTVAGLIRRGKIAAHAIDLCAPEVLRKGRGVDPDTLIHAAMEYYVTSVGQADIKRNEAFVRVLRNSVAFSTRTLRAWMDPDGNFGVSMPSEEQNFDLADQTVARNAAAGVAEKELCQKAALIFGLAPVAWRQEGGAAVIDRTSLLFHGDESDREVAYALLRLAARIRNTAFHFKTRARLIQAVTKRLLQPVPANAIEPLATRQNGAAVEESALVRLHSLLDFDMRLDTQVLVNQLNALHIGAHVPPGQRRNLLSLLARIPGSDDIVTPKFMAVLRRAKDILGHSEANVPEAIKPFAVLDLSNLSKTPTGANHARIGLLRLLYDRAFPNWLEKNEENRAFLVGVFDDLLACKTRRRAAYEDERKAVPSGEEPFADKLLVGVTTLAELDLRFAAETMTTSGRAPNQHDDSPLPDRQRHDPYRPDVSAQQRNAEQLEQLRREVYLALFATFLIESRLGFIWAIDDASEDAAPIAVEEIPAQSGSWEDWHKQFYAWLYLVPPDQIALLRHQFRKSRILEVKALRDRGALMSPKSLGRTDDDPAAVSAREAVLALANAPAAAGETLVALDQLMGLYTRIQGAGFAGNEHVASLQQGAVLYEDPRYFETIFSEAAETHHLSVPGTRRGLRQMIRFGTSSVLMRIFEKHTVGAHEVDAFREVILDGESKIFEERRALHEMIVKSARAKDADRIRLLEDCRRYRDVAQQTSKYDFAISAARLTEFANMHHLLMEVLGRLADFTLTWERDATCLMLGAVLEQFPAGRFEAGDGKIALKIDDVGGGTHRIFSLDKAFSIPGALLDKLDGERSELVARYFRHEPRAEENPKDVKVREARMASARASAQPVPPYKAGTGFKQRPVQIRNDLAHFNLLDSRLGADRSGRPLNLTYVINAVRSLVSYDRKLKNAVPKAVADILLRHGLVIRWRLDRDRLTKAEVAPAYLLHLDFLREVAGHDPRFVIPRASPRAVSMAKALFDFSSRGYMPEAGGIAALTYPEHTLPLPPARRIHL